MQFSKTPSTRLYADYPNEALSDHHHSDKVLLTVATLTEATCYSANIVAYTRLDMQERIEVPHL